MKMRGAGAPQTQNKYRGVIIKGDSLYLLGIQNPLNQKTSRKKTAEESNPPGSEPVWFLDIILPF
jgi:hypothetical protein